VSWETDCELGEKLERTTCQATGNDVYREKAGDGSLEEEWERLAGSEGLELAMIKGRVKLLSAAHIV
jgi:hypothetical protein